MPVPLNMLFFIVLFIELKVPEVAELVEASKGSKLLITELLWSSQGFQIIMQDMDVRNGIGGARIIDDQVVDGLVFALVETDSEIRLRQGAEIVADVSVFAGHIDEYRTERQLSDELMLVGFQHAHEAEVLGGDFGVEVALQDGVRHLVAEDDEPATANTKQSFYAAFDVLDDAFVAFVEND